MFHNQSKFSSYFALTTLHYRGDIEHRDVIGHVVLEANGGPATCRIVTFVGCSTAPGSGEGNYTVEWPIFLAGSRGAGVSDGCYWCRPQTDVRMVIYFLMAPDTLFDR